MIKGLFFINIIKELIEEIDWEGEGNNRKKGPGDTGEMREDDQKAVEV